MVITQVGYFFRMPAFVLSACCPVPSTSKLSSGKNTGWNGEFLLIVSRSPPVSGSSVIFGSGGIGVVSGTGSGGAGGLAAGGVAPPVVVGGTGRATGGFFLPQAPTNTSATARIAIAAKCVCLIAVSSLRKLLFRGSTVRTSRIAYRASIYCDQLANLLFPSRVICRRLFPSRSTVKSCALPFRVDVNAICRPFGENEGLSLLPIPSVTFMDSPLSKL